MITVEKDRARLEESDYCTEEMRELVPVLNQLTDIVHKHRDRMGIIISIATVPQEDKEHNEGRSDQARITGGHPAGQVLAAVNLIRSERFRTLTQAALEVLEVEREIPRGHEYKGEA